MENITVDIHKGTFARGGKVHYAILQVGGEVQDIHTIRNERERGDLLMAVARAYFAQDNKTDFAITLSSRDVAQIGTQTWSDADGGTVCRIMQETFHLFPTNHLTGPIPIPGIANSGTNQCYASVLVHVLMQQWGPILDQEITRFDTATEQLSIFPNIHGSAGEAIRALVHIRRQYVSRSMINPNDIGRFITAVNQLRPGSVMGSDGGDPCELLTPLVQALVNTSPTNTFTQYYQQLKNCQTQFDRDQAYLNTTLSGLPSDPQNIQQVAQNRLEGKTLPSILPLKIERTNASGTQLAHRNIEVAERVTINTSQYELCSAIVHDQKDPACPHYIAYIKTGGAWVKADDRRTSWVRSTPQLLTELSCHGVLLQYQLIPTA